MKVEVVSVRLKSLVSISDKAFKAVAFDGSEAIIPKSQVYGDDFEVQNSEAYWISQWLLEQKPGFQWTDKKKKTIWKDPKTGLIRDYINVTIEHHIPKRIEATKVNVDEDLIR